MEVQSELLRKLKCDNCGGILSCYPILISTKGKNMCGRCKVSEKAEEIFTRNIIYEEFASGFLFPCQYQEKGCIEMLKMNAVKKHEETCKYNTHRCPTAALQNNCTWNGPLEDIENHYKNSHLELIVQHPYEQRPNIKQSYIKYTAFNEFGHFFILQEKCDVRNSKFYFSVVCVGPPYLAELFEFTCKLGKGKDCISKTRQVQYNPLFIMHEKGCVSQKINNIFQELGDYDQIDLHLR